jgi:hypothetical protein
MFKWLSDFTANHDIEITSARRFFHQKHSGTNKGPVFTMSFSSKPQHRSYIDESPGLVENRVGFTLTFRFLNCDSVRMTVLRYWNQSSKVVRQLQRQDWGPWIVVRTLHSICTLDIQSLDALCYHWRWQMRLKKINSHGQDACAGRHLYRTLVDCSHQELNVKVVSWSVTFACSASVSMFWLIVMVFQMFNW